MSRLARKGFIKQLQSRAWLHRGCRYGRFRKALKSLFPKTDWKNCLTCLRGHSPILRWQAVELGWPSRHDTIPAGLSTFMGTCPSKSLEGRKHRKTAFYNFSFNSPYVGVSRICLAMKNVNLLEIAWGRSVGFIFFFLSS